MQRHIRIGIFLLTLAVVFFFARSPVSQNVDFWVHLKLGELQSSKGILHKDLLSFVTSGREAYPQQWLFQIFVYRYVQVFGLQNAQYIASISGVLFVFVLWCLFRKVLNSSLWESIFAIAVFFIGTIDFLNLRAQMFAYFFAVCAFSLIFLYIKKGRNYLWLTVPLMIVWNNIHASLFLAIYFFASYAVLQFFLKGRSKAKVLLMYVLCGLLISVLPPLGTGQWRYLWFFVQHRKVVDSFGEWLPLYRSFADFIVYVFFCICAALVWIIRLREKKVSKNEVVFLPLVLLVFSAFFALRNLFLGYICISILFAQGIRGLKLTRIVRVALFLILIGMLWVFWQKETNDVAHVPQRASDFIRAQNIRGKMFSDFVGSSYFLWSLAPERKIFMDIRLELYACCELPEYEHAFLDKVNASDGDFFASVDAFFASYGFDYAVLPTDQNSFWRRIDEHLLSLPQWSLVYWDDRYEIFVRRSSGNDTVISNYGTEVADPYGLSLFRATDSARARLEYQRMDTFVDSARSRNALAVLDMQNHDLQTATEELHKAIEINPNFDSPYMNLGEIDVVNGNPSGAISMYRKALEINPRRAFTKMRLEQLLKASP